MELVKLLSFKQKYIYQHSSSSLVLRLTQNSNHGKRVKATVLTVVSYNQLKFMCVNKTHGLLESRNT